MSNGKRHILVVSAYGKQRSIRASRWDYIMAFGSSSRDRVYYLNLHRKSPPRYIGTVDFDLIVFELGFFQSLWSGDTEAFRGMMKKAHALRRSRAVKAMLPMDEFQFSDPLSEFINSFQIDCVFSLASGKEWPHIYRGVDLNRVTFRRVLPAYFTDERLRKISALCMRDADRQIDIGYRVPVEPAYWFGRHGMLKYRVAEVFREQAARRGLNVDIQVGRGAEIVGDDWYRFLGSCKYTIGVEGGSSLMDHDGAIRRKSLEYLKARPGATFEEVEQACFPGLDGRVELRSLSPRHLEACATRTCQILVEGDYSGVLKAGVHYIPVKRDFSNIGDVLDSLRDDQRREAIVEQAYQDIVCSGKYSYSRFVDFVTSEALGDAKRRSLPFHRRAWHGCVWCWMRLVDALEQRGIRVKRGIRRARRRTGRAGGRP